MTQRLPVDLRPAVTGFLVAKLVDDQGAPTWEPLVATLSCTPAEEWVEVFRQLIAEDDHGLAEAGCELEGAELRFLARNDASARLLARHLKALVDNVAVELVRRHFSSRRAAAGSPFDAQSH